MFLKQMVTQIQDLQVDKHFLELKALLIKNGDLEKFALTQLKQEKDE